jgi:hypothetical protein
MTAKLKVFNVTGRLSLIVQIDIKADSFEDALAQSTELKEQDFITINGDFMDGKISIVGVQKDQAWDLDKAEGK